MADLRGTCSTGTLTGQHEPRGETTAPTQTPTCGNITRMLGLVWDKRAEP